jgi:hypothetical protein
MLTPLPAYLAGVPGMVAGMLRHLRSLRLMRRDAGWINTLLAEAENERMHLLTFLELRKPGRLFRGAVLVAQVRDNTMEALVCNPRPTHVMLHAVTTAWRPRCLSVTA